MVEGAAAAGVMVAERSRHKAGTCAARAMVLAGRRMLLSGIDSGDQARRKSPAVMRDC
jgi:hypothetical protein